MESYRKRYVLTIQDTIINIVRCAPPLMEDDTVILLEKLVYNIYIRWFIKIGKMLVIRIEPSLRMDARPFVIGG